MEQTDNKSPKLLIRQAFERGERLTTFTGNQIGHTVDFRKVVSELRDEGISDKGLLGESLGRTEIQGLLSRKCNARSSQRAK